MSESEIWRYRCPEGHTSWQHRQGWKKEAKSEYYCDACRMNGDDPHFDELQDMKEQ
jgi:hypothetical protein